MAERRVDIIVGAKDEASGKIKSTVDKVRKELSTVQNLKGGLGEESALGNVGKILSGAGAVAGLALAGRQLNALADKTADWGRELRSGEKSAGQIGEEVAKSLPIFGPLIEAGRKFRGMLDGSAEAAEKMRLETTAIDARTVAMAASAAIVNDKWGGLPEIIQKVRQELDVLRAPEQDRGKLSIGFSAEDERRSAVKTAEDSAKAVREAWQKAEEAERPNVQAAQARMQAAKDAKGVPSFTQMLGGFEGGDGGVGATVVSAEAAKAAAAAEGEFQAATARTKAAAMKRDADLLAIEKQRQVAMAEIGEKEARQKAELDKQLQRDREARWSEEFKFLQDVSRQRVDLARETARRIADINGTMQDARLRLAGKGFQADAQATWRGAKNDVADAIRTALAGTNVGGGALGITGGFIDAQERLKATTPLTAAINAQRDQALEMQWKAKGVDLFKAALSGPTLKDLAQAVIPAASASLTRGLFGGTGPNLREVPPVTTLAPTPFAALREARLLTGAGLDDPALRIAREQKAIMAKMAADIAQLSAAARQTNVVKLFN